MSLLLFNSLVTAVRNLKLQMRGENVILHLVACVIYALLLLVGKLWCLWL